MLAVHIQDVICTGDVVAVHMAGAVPKTLERVLVQFARNDKSVVNTRTSAFKRVERVALLRARLPLP